MKEFNGKTVLVTGGSSGIGLATAKLFQSRGAQLVVTGRDPEKLDAAQNQLGPSALVVASEASDLAQIDALMALIKQHFGQLDVLFANAGVATAAPIERTSEALFDQMMNTNVKGVFFTIQKALPLFNDPAAIIVTTSITNVKAAPNFSVYGAGKAALRSLVQSLSLPLIARGVRINAICPGPIDTPIFDRFGLPDEMVQTSKRETARKSPMQRFGTPEEIAKLVAFLASDDSSYIVGEEIVIDGGISLL